MDSTAAEGDEMRAAKRARLTPSAAGDDADLISGLDDGVLVRVLGLVPDARDAVRTSALSRRWRGLWRCVPTLRFTSRPASSAAESCAALGFGRYVSFVNGILARSNCPIESLEISYAADSEHNNLKQLMSASVDAVQGWIRYTFQHGLKSFSVDLDLPDDDHDQQEEEEDEDDHDGDNGCENEPEVRLDDELPSPVRLETIRLALGGARLRLPNTLRFASVTDLSLERVEIADNGGAHLLARLVSSASCPRLQKLRMNKLWFTDHSSEELRLEANMLSELWIEDVSVPMLLELKTPSLRIFHIDTCYSCNNNGVLRVSAPRLEELAFFQLGCPPRLLEVDGDLSCMRSLKICLWSYAHVSRYGKAQNNISMLLLKQCSSSLTCLDVTLNGRQVSKKDVDIISSRVSHLPQITSLIVNVSNSFERHDFGTGVAGLLARFSNLRHLSLHLPFFGSLLSNLRRGVECDHVDHWTSQDISMAHLQEVELTGLTGTNCELWFIKTVLASAERLHKVDVSFNPKCQHLVKSKMDAFEGMLLDEGMWTSHRGEYKLTCLIK